MTEHPQSAPPPPIDTASCVIDMNRTHFPEHCRKGSILAQRPAKRVRLTTANSVNANSFVPYITDLGNTQMNKLKSEQKAKIKNFVTWTQTSEQIAYTCLSRANWNMEYAVDLFYQVCFLVKLSLHFLDNSNNTPLFFGDICIGPFAKVVEHMKASPYKPAPALKRMSERLYVANVEV
ncbi:unnamed protein product [Strongylus vulgaris]|uniref:Uncharacterized protein n=1 Tax=Strongylus vulgaris TaxID=40348 RepID=A0A3P7HZM7_STRVU|nr:unnamed protein product [Strongylus vulgaris]